MLANQGSWATRFGLGAAFKFWVITLIFQGSVIPYKAVHIVSVPGYFYGKHFLWRLRKPIMMLDGVSSRSSQHGLATDEYTFPPVPTGSSTTRMGLYPHGAAHHVLDATRPATLPTEKRGARNV